MTDEKRAGYINDVVRLIDRLGIATAIICFIAWGSVRVCQWVGPHVVTPVVEAHVDFLKTTAKTGKDTVLAIDKIHDVEADQTKILSSVNENQELLLDAISRKGTAGD